MIANLSSAGSEQEYIRKIERMVAECILNERSPIDSEFADILKEITSDSLLTRQRRRGWLNPMDRIADDWAVIVPNEGYTAAKEVLLCQAARRQTEAIFWDGHPQNPPEPYVNPYIKDYRSGYIIGQLENCFQYQGMIEDKESVLRQNGVDIGWLREETNSRRIAPEWFVQEFCKVINDSKKASDLIDKHKDKLLQESKRFAALYTEGRKCGENRFFSIGRRERRCGAKWAIGICESFMAQYIRIFESVNLVFEIGL